MPFYSGEITAKQRINLCGETSGETHRKHEGATLHPEPDTK